MQCSKIVSKTNPFNILTATLRKILRAKIKYSLDLTAISFQAYLLKRS